MGWWSTQIMGGDAPLDIEAEIFDFIHQSLFDENNSMEVKNSLDLQQEELFNFLFQMEDEEVSIALQVMAFEMMKYGCNIKPEIKSRLLEAIKKDDWATSDRERHDVILDFVKQLEEYNNEPTITPQIGLLQTITEHITSGKKGLVNKMPNSGKN